MGGHSPLRFRDLDLKIKKDPYGVCWVEAIGIPADRSEPVELQLRESIAGLRVQFKSGMTAGDSERFGRALFDSLFCGEIGRLWDRVRETIPRQTPLRVRLDFRHEAAELANLPWELMHSTRGEEFHLGRSPNRHVVRCVAGEGPLSWELPTLPTPLRILRVASSPANTPPFDAKRVLKAIDQSLSPAGSAIDTHDVHHITKAGLEEQLRDGDFDIVHYLGHGLFDDDQGQLLLETPGGLAQCVSGHEIGEALVGAGVRLLVLTACDVADVSATDPRLGVAEAALRAHVPAVVAMQGVITDTIAAEFCKAFYRNLIQGRPLEFCVSSARSALWEADRNTHSWSLPVLYSNLADGLLFDRMPYGPLSHEPPAPAHRPRTADSGTVRHPVVVQLPRAWYGELHQRAGELRRLMDLLAIDRQERIIAVNGCPGAGSSSLALELGRRCWERSMREPESRYSYAGVLWTATPNSIISGPLPASPTCGWEVDDLYRQLADRLPAPGLRQAHPEQRSDLVRDELRRHHYLVIIDDFDLLRGLTLDTLAERLPTPTKVIVTAHETISGEASWEVLKDLQPRQAKDYVRRVLGCLGSPTTSQDVLNALTGVSGNPLALRLLAGRWADGEDVTSVVADGTAHEQSSRRDGDPLQTFIDGTLACCGTREMELLRKIAICPAPLEPAEVAHALGCPLEDVTPILARLDCLGLVSSPRGTPVGMSVRIRHALLYGVDDEQAESLIRAAVGDRLSWLLREGDQHHRDQSRHTGDQMQNAMWAARQAYELQDWESVLTFKDALHEVLFQHKLWHYGVDLGAWAYEAADRLGDDRRQAWCALNPIARCYFHQGDYRNSRRWCERALDKFAKLEQGDAEAEQNRVWGVASARRRLGECMQHLGFAQQALLHLEEGLSLVDSGTNVLKGHLLAAVAGAAEASKDRATATTRYRAALDIYEINEEYPGIASTEHRLGCLALDSGQYGEALDRLARSLRFWVRCDWPDRTADVLQSLADLALAREDYDAAEACLMEAKDTFARSVEAQGTYTDLFDIEARLARLRDMRGSKPLSGGYGSSSGSSLDGKSNLTDPHLTIIRIPLRCPVDGCDEQRTAYDYSVDDWPSCPRHHVRMVMKDTGPPAALR